MVSDSVSHFIWYSDDITWHNEITKSACMTDWIRTLVIFQSITKCSPNSFLEHIMDSNYILYFSAICLLLCSWNLTVNSDQLCIGAVRRLEPCNPYFKDRTRTRLCCVGVQSYKDAGKTREDRVSLCNCMKNFWPDKDGRVIQALFQTCEADMNFPIIDKDFDCNKYFFLSSLSS